MTPSIVIAASFASICYALPSRASAAQVAIVDRRLVLSLRLALSSFTIAADGFDRNRSKNRLGLVRAHCCPKP